MAFTQNDFRNLINSYLELSPKMRLTSVLRERNSAKLNNNTSTESLFPYLPVITLIGPNSLTYTGWKHITSVQQTIDGPVLTLTKNADFPTIQIAGTSGDLQTVQDLLNTPVAWQAFNDILPTDFKQNFYTPKSLNNVDTQELLKQFFSVMETLTDAKNLKITNFLMLQSWAEEPNQVNDDNQIFHNLKKITIFDSLYPLGKSYWGVIDQPFNYNITSENYRKADYNLNFLVVKEELLDLKVKNNPSLISVTSLTPNQNNFSHETKETRNKGGVIPSPTKEVVNATPESTATFPTNPQSVQPTEPNSAKSLSNEDLTTKLIQESDIIKNSLSSKSANEIKASPDYARLKNIKSILEQTLNTPNLPNDKKLQLQTAIQNLNDFIKKVDDGTYVGFPSPDGTPVLTDSDRKRIDQEIAEANSRLGNTANTPNGLAITQQDIVTAQQDFDNTLNQISQLSTTIKEQGGQNNITANKLNEQFNADIEKLKLSLSVNNGLLSTEAQAKNQTTLIKRSTDEKWTDNGISITINNVPITDKNNANTIFNEAKKQNEDFIAKLKSSTIISNTPTTLPPLTTRNASEIQKSNIINLLLDKAQALEDLIANLNKSRSDNPQDPINNNNFPGFKEGISLQLVDIFDQIKLFYETVKPEEIKTLSFDRFALLVSQNEKTKKMNYTIIQPREGVDLTTISFYVSNSIRTLIPDANKTIIYYNKKLGIDNNKNVSKTNFSK